MGHLSAPHWGPPLVGLPFSPPLAEEGRVSASLCPAVENAGVWVAGGPGAARAFSAAPTGSRGQRGLCSPVWSRVLVWLGLGWREVSTVMPVEVLSRDASFSALAPTNK